VSYFVATVRMLDFINGSAHVGQGLGTPWASQHPREVQHADAGKNLILHKNTS
jgi:hypothetical protein